MPTITLDLTAGEATRLQDALTETLRLETPATVADARDYIIGNLKQIVRSSESRVAETAAKAALPADLDVT